MKKLYYNADSGRFGLFMVPPTINWHCIHNTPEYDKVYHRFIWLHTEKHGRVVRDPLEVIEDWKEYYKNM